MEKLDVDHCGGINSLFQVFSLVRSEEYGNSAENSERNKGEENERKAFLTSFFCSHRTLNPTI